MPTSRGGGATRTLPTSCSAGRDAVEAMWGRSAVVVVASNILAAALLLAALVYCWPRPPAAPSLRGPLLDLVSRRLEVGNCDRMCVKNEVPLECHYEFVIRPQVILDKSCEETAAGSNGSACSTKNAAAHRKMVFAINGQVPGPPIQVCAGDVVVVDVWNRLPGQQVSLHWVGVKQLGTPYMDGVPMVTQCPIPASSRFRYVFRAATPGTHFYRAHSVSQQAAGLFGALVVKDPQQEDPLSPLHDLPEHVVLVSSWSASGPASIAVTSQVTVKTGVVKAERWLWLSSGRRYKLRLVNVVAADCPVLLDLDQHKLEVISKDGGRCLPFPVHQLMVFPGERYDVVLKADHPAGQYKLRVKGYNSCSGAYEEMDLVYRGATHNNEVTEVKPQVAEQDTKRGFLEACGDPASCVPSLKGAETSEVASKRPDLRFYLPFDVNPVQDFDGSVDFHYVHEGVPYYPAYLNAAGGRPQFGNVSFLYPASPLLSQPEDADAATVCSEDATGVPRCRAQPRAGFCECTRILRAPLNATVELVLVDLGHGADSTRTFHLHGHSFVVVASRSLGRPLRAGEVAAVVSDVEAGLLAAPSPPVDTAPVPNKGYSVWRLRADNPGYWLLESRGADAVEDSGLQLLLAVGADADIPPVPADFPRCGTFKGPDFLFT